MNDAQEAVARFVEQHDLACPPAYRLLDLVAEVGELSSNVTASTAYGAEPASLALEPDELGDVLFAVLALSDAQGIDADAALQTALTKYEARIAETGTVGSDQ